MTRYIPFVWIQYRVKETERNRYTYRYDKDKILYSDGEFFYTKPHKFEIGYGFDSEAEAEAKLISFWNSRPKSEWYVRTENNVHYFECPRVPGQGYAYALNDFHDIKWTDWTIYEEDIK